MDHPDVREAAVIAVPDERWGERPCACVVVREGAVLDDEGVRAFLSDRVAKCGCPSRSGSSPRSQDLGGQVRQEGAAGSAGRGQALSLDPPKIDGDSVRAAVRRLPVRIRRVNPRSEAEVV